MLEEYLEKRKLPPAKGSLVKEELRVWQVCEMPKKATYWHSKLGYPDNCVEAYNRAISDISQLKINVPTVEELTKTILDCNKKLDEGIYEPEAKYIANAILTLINKGVK